ncbi:ATP phosphoribosyltransferase regulatory subunit [Aristophania vespae]|uniref:ATP phosphoribosyltransferase regulatory subunit n=1 Tax=Aristophania vespae TaxID=2697033 RepID=A0A6P1NDH7_9PROT|nr:ATP phosphoribosyltransferase regulatory subunit [Aristophania vespae]QHI94997.1 ATP phosphoribosyltransferase regulatory subunit [Aristophania vespae]UMM64168.1 ATP phosphoribosyltransferase regulatory subunit [Aristophania vespae]
MMGQSEASSPSLLPMGFVDLLPGEAEAEAHGIAKVMDIFGAHGYERVRPPLLEFESSLLSGAGEALSEQTFRLLDPSSHRMMALRPDITTQIARISQVRLQELPRPLRLSYAGDCIVIGTVGREADRQILQAGIELIGPDHAEADAEVIALGAKALAALNIKHVSFDLSMPVLVWSLLDKTYEGSERDYIIHALDRRDAAAVAEYGGAMAQLLLEMMNASGPADQALERLKALSFPDDLKQHVYRLEASVQALKQRLPDLRLTIDPVDFRGWRYHTGLCVTVFALKSREELGRGGRYLAGNEPACGLTLHPQALLKVAPIQARRPRCLVPQGVGAEILSALHKEGFATIEDLEKTQDPLLLARRLRCSHLWQNGRVEAL